MLDSIEDDFKNVDDTKSENIFGYARMMNVFSAVVICVNNLSDQSTSPSSDRGKWIETVSSL